VVKLLLEHGADPTVQDVNKWTPLVVASFRGHEEVRMMMGMMMMMMMMMS
jgi:ankyrin repeat protein